jgi:general secretion pathway protein J
MHPRQCAGRHESGLTLLEVVVALAIMSVLSVLAYRGIQIELDVRATVESERRAWEGLAAFFERFSADIALVSLSNSQLRRQHSANLANDSAIGMRARGEEISFARIAGDEGVQFIGYRFSKPRLERRAWGGLSPNVSVFPHSGVMLDEVSDFTMRFLGHDGNWRDNWNSSDAHEQMQSTLPMAIMVRLSVSGLPTVERTFVVGVQ